jgi:hypothetical protein
MSAMSISAERPARRSGLPLPSPAYAASYWPSSPRVKSTVAPSSSLTRGAVFSVEPLIGSEVETCVLDEMVSKVRRRAVGWPSVTRP